MVKIDSSSFGSITIDGRRYDYDVYILPSGKIEEREHSHTFDLKQVEHVLEKNPDVVILGEGVFGYASPSQEARNTLKEKKVGLIEVNTPEVKDKFNGLSKSKRVAAIIHVSC